MQPLRFFSIIIIALVVIIIASSNFSFKPGNNVNSGVNTKASIIDSNLLSIDEKSIFSSLLQTISAQEQEQEEAEQLNEEEEDDGKDSDAIMKEEGDNEENQQNEKGSSEPKSSLEQEDAEKKEEQKHDEIKEEDCRQEENTDSEIGSCMPEEEGKDVCDDRDNYNDSRIYSEDPQCSPNKGEQEEEQQLDNKDEPEGKEEPRQEIEREASLNNKDDNNSEKSPVTMEEQNNNTSSNNSTSSDVSDIENKAENSSENSTDMHSTERRRTTTKTITNSSASINGSQQLANASTAEDNSFALSCNPAETKMLPGEESSIICTIENKTPKTIKLVLACSGLQGTGIECYIDGESYIEKILKERSHTNFAVLLVSRSSPPVTAGSYPFTISAELCINSDLC